MTGGTIPVNGVAPRIDLRGFEQTILELNGHGLHAWEAEVVRQAGALADRLVLQTNPAVQACRRMRLPADYLYTHRGAVAVYRLGEWRL